MNRKLLGAAAFSLALAGGGAAGAVLGTPNLSLAQDSSSSDDATEVAPDGVPGPHGRGVELEAAATAIGISEDELHTALEGGQSIAQVAEAHDVDLQTVIDAMVAAGTERLQAAIDALPDRVAEAVQREGLPDRGPGHRHGHFGAGLDAAAAAIGIDSEELRAALRDGSTVAEVAQAHDVDVQTVIDALVADAEKAVDEAVTDGRITEDRAAEIKANLPDGITAMVNGEGRFGDHDGPPPADESDTTEGSGTAA
jgi:transposase-like protein